MQPQSQKMRQVEIELRPSDVQLVKEFNNTIGELNKQAEILLKQIEAVMISTIYAADMKIGPDCQYGLDDSKSKIVGFIPDNSVEREPAGKIIELPEVIA